MKRCLPSFVAFLTVLSLAAGGRAASLMSGSGPALGWKFDNGQEFPGATGSLAVDPEAKREGKPTLRLSGDFTHGGNILLGPQAEWKTVALWLSDATVVEPPPAAAGTAKTGDVAVTVPVDMLIEGEADATFDNGGEFPGAKGSLGVVKDQPEKGQTCLKLCGDFSGGGGYVQIIKDLKSLELGDLGAYGCG